MQHIRYKDINRTHPLHHDQTSAGRFETVATEEERQKMDVNLRHTHIRDLMMNPAREKSNKARDGHTADSSTLHRASTFYSS